MQPMRQIFNLQRMEREEKTASTKAHTISYLNRRWAGWWGPHEFLSLNPESWVLEELYTYLGICQTFHAWQTYIVDNPSVSLTSPASTGWLSRTPTKLDHNLIMAITRSRTIDEILKHVHCCSINYSQKLEST